MKKKKHMKKVCKKDLFLKLAQPNENGVSRWVMTTEFKGKYAALRLGNGFDFGRTGSPLERKYIIETDATITPGTGIDAIRLAGFNTTTKFNQAIRPDIKEAIKKRKCVMLGVNGTSKNVKIEVDHKDGRKNDMRVSEMSTQKIEDFQPLCKAANDIKREICKRCKLTNKRWNARDILGNPYPFYEGDENYTEDLGCVGCYQYDPVEYRKRSARRLSEEAVRQSVEFIMNQLYPEE